jgi:hypothetical protein
MEIDGSKFEEVFLKNNLLFSTNFRIEAQDQSFLIDYVRAKGFEFTPEVEMPPFWIGSEITYPLHPDLEKVPIHLRPWWRYYSRLNTSVNWGWVDNSASVKIKQILEPIVFYFSRLTRISLVVQIPGQNLPAHRDLVVGSEYAKMCSEELTLSGAKQLKFKGPKWYQQLNMTNLRDLHRDQLYLTLKVPISEDIGSCGRPFVIFNGKKIYYSSDNQFFFINEVDLKHGADAVDFYRGVVFVDGFIDMRKFHKLPKNPIRIIST